MANDNLTELCGQIERITFRSEETGFTIARLKVAGRKDLVTVVGHIANPTPGEILSLKGEWGHHPKFGEQFKILSSESAVPATVTGIEKYLGSGLIKGLGPVMAARIVEKFREQTLDVIEHPSEALLAIGGIGPKRIAMIKKAWAEQKEIRAIMIFLQSHGVGAGYATRIFKHYGARAIDVVKENPYRLATDIFGIGFLSADKIAEKLGFARDSELRAEAGILYVLHALTDEGHVYYPYEPLIAKCREILTIDREIIGKALATIVADRRIVIETLDREPEEGRETKKAVYLVGYHAAETQLAARLRALIQSPRAVPRIEPGKVIPWLQEKLAITLAEKQIEAIRAVADHKALVVTGGPGTGKTTIINAMLRIFSGIRTKILLAAPTGRAAKRMTEATGREAKTIHRLLEFSFPKGGFQKTEDSPLDCDLLILDEASMIDTLLMQHLLKAVPAGATLVLVGDVNQLPSVGAGNVLRDIIDSGAVPVVELNEIFRQARESSIIVNAHLINRGRMPNLASSQEKLDDFYFIEQEDPQRVLELIITLVRERIPKRFGFDPLDEIQVLTPMHRGIVGGQNLNVELQKALNPGGEGVSRMGRLYRIGDKVMQIANNYDKEVYNGDIGRITAIDREGQEVVACIDGREIVYDFSELDELVHAYAVSIHKSQGSEYPAVVIPILTQHYILLQRNLLYTGVTRGKKLVVIVGTKKALAIAIRNDKTERRYTRLSERLRGEPLGP
ncbi:MAG: ATP-dependent RecD-like DNA helicase [Deltaproteobacteria bacterium]|nr:ATP-dependent RecD-like DNA helicase [Deltaproteobacteria bacterium]